MVNHPWISTSAMSPVPVLAAAAAVGIVAGTVLGIYNTVQIQKIWAELDVMNQKMIAFETILSEFSLDIVEIQDKIHGVPAKRCHRSCL